MAREPRRQLESDVLSVKSYYNATKLADDRYYDSPVEEHAARKLTRNQTLES